MATDLGSKVPDAQFAQIAYRGQRSRSSLLNALRPRSRPHTSLKPRTRKEPISRSLLDAQGSETINQADTPIKKFQFPEGK
jgi:hypothetical protein